MSVDRKVLSLKNSAEREAIIQLNAIIAGTLAGNLASATPGVTIGTTADTSVKIATAFTMVVNGVPVTVAAAEVALTATTHDIADPDADPREALYLLTTDSQGNVTITKGSDAAAGAAALPDVPAGESAFAKVLIQHDGTAIFNATTDALDAAHLTVTYTDLVQVVSQIAENGTVVTA